jgi:hypothetical protein
VRAERRGGRKHKELCLDGKKVCNFPLPTWSADQLIVAFVILITISSATIHRRASQPRDSYAINANPALPRLKARRPHHRNTTATPPRICMHAMHAMNDCPHPRPQPRASTPLVQHSCLIALHGRLTPRRTRARPCGTLSSCIHSLLVRVVTWHSRRKFVVFAFLGGLYSVATKLTPPSSISSNISASLSFVSPK